MVCRELNIKWTYRCEVWEEGNCVQRPTVWDGVNQDGKKVRVYIIQIDPLDEEELGNEENKLPQKPLH